MSMGNLSRRWFRVRALNAVGAGTWSNGSSPVTPAKPSVAPDAPAIGTATAGNAAAVIRWTAPATTAAPRSPATRSRC
jgi:hypothetical protein